MTAALHRRVQPTTMLLAVAVLFAGGGLIARGAPLSGPSLAFWRSIAGATVYQGILIARGRRPSLADLRTAALGGVGFGLSVVCLFIAFKSTTLVSANVIGSLQPVLLGLVSHRFGGDRVGRRGWVAIGTAVIGTAIVVIGSSTHNGQWSLRGDLFAVASVLVGCLYPIGTKRARESMGALRFQAAALWVSAAVTLPAMLLTAHSFAVPSPHSWLWVVGLVAVGGSGHVLFSSAQHHVSVATSSTIVLLEVIGVAIGAAVFFGQSISLVQVVGMMIVAIGVGRFLT